MMIRSLPLSVLLLAGVSACADIPPAAYQNRGGPESLLNVSSEVVAVQLTSEDSLNELTNWIENDQPTRAQLYCSSGDPMCGQAEDLFKAYGLDYATDSGAQSSVDLVYERVTARDCDSRYIDNTINPYNLPHPTFGCSISANTIQMVGDKKQFVSPGLLDYHDANKAIENYNKYINPLELVPQRESLGVESIASQTTGN